MAFSTNGGGVRLSDDWFHLHCGDIVLQSLHLAPAGMMAIQPRCVQQDGPGAWALSGRADGWMHTLHFRPGWPQIRMLWDLEHSIQVHCLTQDVAIQLACDTPHALIASLNLWFRPGVEIVEGKTAELLRAGDTVRLRGAETLLIRSHSSELRITGLPPAAHKMQLLPRQPIPSVMRETCGVLCLGLRLPVRLQLYLQFSRRGAAVDLKHAAPDTRSVPPSLPHNASGGVIPDQ